MMRQRSVPRPALFLLGFMLPVLLPNVLCLAQEPTKPTAAQQFKNIKVLKDLPADQLVPMMFEFNKGLGVKCDYCHVDDKSKDDKPTKETARGMIVMLQGVNKKLVEMTKEKKESKGNATCFTCHRGKTEPLSQPKKEEEVKQ